MSTQINADGSISIVAMSLLEFLPEVIKAAKDGYVLDVDSNAGYPQSIGHLITVTMFPAAPKHVNPVKVVHTEHVAAVVVEAADATVKLDGRKKQK